MPAVFSMVELIDASRFMFDEVAAGFRQPDAPRMTLEQEDAKVILQHFHTNADARLADAERIGSMADVQILGDSERLDQ